MINVCTCELYEKDNELIVFLNDAILDLFGFLPSPGSRWPQSVSLNKWTFNGHLSASQVEKGKHLSRERRKKLIKLAIHLGYRCCKVAMRRENCSSYHAKLTLGIVHNVEVTESTTVENFTSFFSQNTKAKKGQFNYLTTRKCKHRKILQLMWFSCSTFIFCI